MYVEYESQYNVNSSLWAPVKSVFPKCVLHSRHQLKQFLHVNAVNFPFTEPSMVPA